MVFCRLITSIPLAIILVFITILAILGNIFLFTVICQSRKAHKKSYSHYLTLLTITDSLSILFLLKEFIERFYQKTHKINNLYEQSEIMCKLEHFIRFSCFFISGIATVFLTVERFLIVYWPVRGRLLCGGNRALIIIFGIIVFSCSAQSFRLVFVEQDSGVCVFKMNQKINHFILSCYSSGLFVYVIPAVVILVFNILILMKLQKSNNKTKCQKCVKERLNAFNILSAKFWKSFRFGKMDLSTNRRQLNEYDSSGPSDRSTSTYDGSVACSKCLYMRQGSAKYYLKVKRRASVILLMISFSYLICHAWNTAFTGVFLRYYYLYAARLQNVSDNSTEKAQLKDSVLGYFRRKLCLYNDIIDMFSIIGYGNNFYIYYIFGNIFRTEFARIFQNVGRSIRNRFGTFKSQTNQKDKLRKVSKNYSVIHKNDYLKPLYYYPTSECCVHSNLEPRKIIYQKNSYQSVRSCPLKYQDSSQSSTIN
uniref:Orphan chemoreceptor family protein n=1 Tax=Schmidtea mediterranea TaxID=79327 RepID=A0A193KTZ7_SCHMD|nr:orphan chemoreceptor family protein [Schmidtea mediterranea]